MKKYLASALLVLGTTVALANNTTLNEGNNSISKKEKVLALLNSIQTPNNEVIKYISRYNIKQKNIKDQIKDLEKAKHVIDILIEKIKEK